MLYGSDAMSGVVNIVTRRARKPLEVGARFDYGSFSTIHSRISAGTKQGDFHALASVDKAVSDGHLPNSEYNGSDFSLRAGYKLNPRFDVDFTGKYFTGVKHEPSKATAPDSVATGWNQYDRGGLDLTATANTDVVNGFLKLYRTFGEHQFDPDDGWHSQDHTDGALLHLHRRLVPGNLLQFGIDLKHQQGNWWAKFSGRPDSGAVARLEGAAFIQDEQEFGPVAANAGVRLHLDEDAGIVLAPKAGLVVRLPLRASVRASVNRGFRAPSFNYTTFLPPHNPDLKPEYSWNLSLIHI